MTAPGRIDVPLVLTDDSGRTTEVNVVLDALALYAAMLPALPERGGHLDLATRQTDVEAVRAVYDKVLQATHDVVLAERQEAEATRKAKAKLDRANARAAARGQGQLG